MPLRVLVIDDEPDLELLITQRFKKEIRNDEYSFVFAHNGKVGLDVLEQDSTIELVMTDINMPEMDGLTFISHLSDRFPHLKPIIVSAYDDIDNIRLAMNLGAFDFITKPIDFEDLKITMEKTHELCSTLKRAKLLEDNYKKELEEKVMLRTKELEVLNHTLETRVIEEMDRRRAQEQMLIQQSKMASMGEMLAAIAHQWRQPLNLLTMILQDIKEAQIHGELNENYLSDSVKEGTDQIQFMSQTIDDFRDFYRPAKQWELFDVQKAIIGVLEIFSGHLRYYDIDAEFFCVNRDASLAPVMMIANEIPVYCGEQRGECIANGNSCQLVVGGFPNEFKQVVLNIINNAKDAILERKEKSPETFSGKICLSTTLTEDNMVEICIQDNGGGIPADVLPNIFDAYFTTKSSDKGTGLGLYMSKVIVEKNLAGEISVRNEGEGALFTISLMCHQDSLFSAEAE